MSCIIMMHPIRPSPSLLALAGCLALLAGPGMAGTATGTGTGAGSALGYGTSYQKQRLALHQTQVDRARAHDTAGLAQLDWQKRKLMLERQKLLMSGSGSSSLRTTVPAR